MPRGPAAHKWLKSKIGMRACLMRRATMAMSSFLVGSFSSRRTPASSRKVPSMTPANAPKHDQVSSHARKHVFPMLHNDGGHTKPQHAMTHSSLSPQDVGCHSQHNRVMQGCRVHLARGRVFGIL